MKPATRLFAAGLLALTVSPSMGAAGARGAAEFAPGRVVSFRACPVFRDTHLERGCWLARWRGRLFFIGHRPVAGSNPAPQLLHQILVEGVIADEPKTCGGIVIHPVKLSTITELDRRCDEVLPADGYGPAPRSTAESAAMLVPGWGGGPGLASTPTPVLTPPFKAATYTIRFDFDSVFLTAPNRPPVAAAAALTNATHGKVVVTGYRVDSQLSDGDVAREARSRAQDRAETLVEALRRLGVPPADVSVRDVSVSAPQDGVHAPDLRRATIEVTPQ